MVDVQKTFGYSDPLNDLPNNKTPGSNNTAPYIDLTESDYRSTNHSADIIDLTDDDNRHNISDIPVIDLTGDDEDLVNCRIPVIDLTDDDVQDITNKTQCVDDDDDTSSSKHTIYNIDIGEIDDRVNNRSTKHTDLTLEDIQDFNLSTSVTDLTFDNGQFLNLRIRCTYTTNDVPDIADQLQNFDITDDKQLIRNYCILTNDLKNHRNDRIITLPDMTSQKDCNNDRKQIIDSKRNNVKVIRKLVDAERHYLSCFNSHTSLQSGVIENNFRIPAAYLSNIANENAFLNYNETSNTNAMPTNTFSSMQKFQSRKENFANHPLKHFECWKETSLTNHSPKIFTYRKEKKLTNHPLRKSYEDKIEMNSTNNPLRNKFEDRKESIWTNHLVTNNSEKKYSMRRKSEEISRNNSADFMEPALYPIPLRHSLGRSTVNTSKNIPIECAEASEDESRILTVSSIMRKRKSKSVTNISEKNLPKSKELSTTRENTFFFETLKRIFLKFWIVLLFTFIGLYFRL